MNWLKTNLSDSRASVSKAPRDMDMDFPQELRLFDANDIEFIKNSNNPLIWHEAATAIFTYSRSNFSFLHWVVGQPALDRATAGLMLLGYNEGSRFLKGESLQYGGNMGQAEYEAILRSLADRCLHMHFVPDRIALNGAYVERERTSCVAALEISPIQAPLRGLKKVVEEPFLTTGEEGAYQCVDDSGSLVNRDWWNAQMDKMFDREIEAPAAPQQKARRGIFGWLRGK